MHTPCAAQASKPSQAMDSVLFDYTRQDATGTCSTAQAWARQPAPLSPPERATMKARAAALLKQHKAVLVAHLQGNAPQVSVEIGRSNIPSIYQPPFSEMEPILGNLPAPA